MKYINILNKIIEFSFYSIVFLVPLVLMPDTSELFEFNKLWLTFILSLVILTAWISKMLIKKQFKIQRTPLDIPIVLFLLSQVIATVFSIDRHVSLWGYYSRFNGGLLSIITYIFLYYAFVSNFRENAKTVVKRLIYVALASAAIVTAWGLPSHYGYDPTCLVFRGTFDVSCWTSDFQPKARIFSTLGQPDWLAAYLAILLPIPVAFFIKSKFYKTLSNTKRIISRKDFGYSLLYLSMFILFYIDLAFARSKSGFLGIWFSAFFFTVVFVFLKLKTKTENVKKLPLDLKLFTLTGFCFVLVTFLIGTSFARIDGKFSLYGLNSTFFGKPPAVTKTAVKPVATPPPPLLVSGELGGTDSGTIRQIVWEGAINAWLHNPIFGTGVETFAFTYYKYRPAAHNLTSEWRYLYNKAHNEYLNYLATTGLFGFATYLSIIGLFLFLSLKFLWKNRNEDTNNRKILILALVSGYTSILVTNFFGFSVVIVNIFMFLIPALVFTLANLINYDKTLSFSFTKKNQANSQSEDFVVSKPVWVLIGVSVLITGYFVFTLINFWNADRDYAKGYNLDRVNSYQTAYPLLNSAVKERPDEPTFKDELSINNAVLAIAVLQQKTTDANQQKQVLTLAQKLAGDAITLSDQVTSENPNNVVFWKTRVRVFYTLAQADSRYLQQALAAIKKCAELAPTDADISYNLGILYGQNGDAKNAVSTLENTIKLKPDFGNAYYALGIFYHQLAINNKGQVVNSTYQQKAIDTMRFMLKNLAPNDSRPIDALKSWGVDQK
jgi:tetratricopeptide (TPR) repeat protein